VSGATVAFGASAATGVVVESATTITAISPAHAESVVDVTVTTPAGTSSTEGTGNNYTYAPYATAPSAIDLAAGSANAVGGVTNVAIPEPGETDTTGAVTGWVTGTADTIMFTVTDAGGTSTITINGVAYTSGTDYTIAAASPLTIVVTTTETDTTPAVRTFTVSVTAAP
jgi:hypothetical protein